MSQSSFSVGTMMSRQQTNLHFFLIAAYFLAFSSSAAGQIRLSCVPKPNISMSPAGEVTWGRDVSITCSISTQVLGGTFILQQTSGSFRETSTNSATFNIGKVDFDKEGSYQCQYQQRGSSQTFSSSLSDSVRLSVTVSLQQPIIFLTSSNRGALLILQGAEVTRGYNFGITCFIYSTYPEGRFFLIFSGSTITETKPAVNYSASFNFPAAQYEHQGNYSCVYEVTLSTRRFNSTESAPITVIVTMSLLPLVSSVTAGILLLLLLFVAFFIYRRRRQDNQPANLIFSQLTVGVDDNYEDEEDDSYVNVDQLEKKEIKEEVATVAKEESDNYEDPETDSDHDYEEESPAENNIKPKEISLSLEDYSDHDEEDDDEEDKTSDDEDDYVNICE
ncbi:hypothetical protein Q5P01_016715 [Channa striata]|uniref:Ig-like domain-containing protein n=1 Tax=Channa striata TaxID=64152 RepID=A0AA88MC21_CHASR|nr:hypothetical protein Q5P01_016715 [Channa striata]